MRAVIPLGDLSIADVPLAGGKGASLGELARAGLPIPPGFVVTSEAYVAAIEAAGARQQLRDILTRVVPDDDDSLQAASDSAAGLLQTIPLPTELVSAVSAAYRALGSKVVVAVRSSSVSEDSVVASFAGINASFTNVRGQAQLLRRVRGCWASLYCARALAYRFSVDQCAEPTMAVIVQHMVQSEQSGVMFTADPATADAGRLVIEAVFGQGEAIVAGMVEPDTYLLNRDPLRIMSTRVGHQSLEIIHSANGGDRSILLEAAKGARRVLSAEQVLEIARLGLQVEAHYGSPQDVEWARADDRTWLVQSRPITILSASPVDPTGPRPGTVVVRGLAASCGTVSGRVRVVRTPQDARQLRQGEVLVAPMASPDWVPVMNRASALVTDGGGVTCHGAIVARELRIPCVVGTGAATSVLHDGDWVTVDGQRGEITRRRTAEAAGIARRAPTRPRGRRHQAVRTRLNVNLAVADRVAPPVHLDGDVVGPAAGSRSLMP